MVPGFFRKVGLVILDGLRPDAVTPERMPVLSRLLERGWRAPAALTVRPSITIAALTSIATGVSPERHQIVDPGVGNLGRVRGLRPLPRELGQHGVRTSVITAPLPGPSRWLVGALLRLGGAHHLASLNASPAGMIDRAVVRLQERGSREFVVSYINDTDLAGHAWGWMSAAYLHAARTIDSALDQLEPLLDDPETLLLLTADHGGGGVLPHDHDHPHPVNDAIPIMMLGARTAPAASDGSRAHLLDLPATILHAFGVPVPSCYEGRILHEGLTLDYAEAV
jgi:arylsulfatase A-like enzyme